MTSFSIIIPTYNSGQTLDAALSSIAEQSFKDLEVIIQDGNSQDDTVAVAERYATRIPALRIYVEKDQGIYDAMNKAMTKVTGAWMFFLGSDDKFHSNAVLQHIFGEIQKSKADVVYGDVQILGDTGWAKDGERYAGPFNLQKLLNQNICHQAMFYRSDFVKQKLGDFNTDYTKSADWDFNLKAWANGNFEYLDVVVADFAAGGLSSSSTDFKLEADFVQNVLKYFRISPFNQAVNRTDFIYYGQVVAIQREKYKLQYQFRRLMAKIVKKLGLRS